MANTGGKMAQLVTLLGVLVVASACGSASAGSPAAASSAAPAGASGVGSASGAASSGGSASLASGTPVPLSLIADLNAPKLGLNYEEVAAGGNAAVAAVNAAGGIKGRPLKLTICDAQGDPNKSLECARSAVSSDSVAVVGHYVFTTSLAPVLEPAGLADVMNNPSQTGELKSKTSFPVTASATLGTVATADLAVQQLHAKKVSLIGEGPGVALFPNIEKALTSQGAEVPAKVTSSQLKPT